MTLQTFLNKIANPWMKWLLRSPLHSIVSRRVVLIEFVGRKSGKTYRTPTMYAPTSDGIVISTSKDYQWCRNLSGGTQVRLWLCGHERHGTADVSLEEHKIDAALRAIYAKAAPHMLEKMKARELVTIHIRLKDSR
jgi:deazaflavin-dependent oxidoreductase (nitroreductase family)